MADLAKEKVFDMDEKLVQLVQSFLPDGSSVTNIYKDDSGEVKVDITLPDGSAMTGSLKKNHTGEIYLD